MEDNRSHPPSPSITKAIEQLLATGASGTLVTIIDANENVGLKLLLDEHGNTTGGLGDPELESVVTSQAFRFLAAREATRAFRVSDFAPELSSLRDTLLLFERIQPDLRLVICGAGHVGATLARLASLVGYHTTLIDDRAEFVARERFSDVPIELVLTENWAVAVGESIGSGKGVAIAVVTRGHNEDEECMRAVIKSDPDYIGLIGSKRRTNIVIDRLRDGGADDQVLHRIRAPIGLDIGAVTPEEVALAILAEIVAERRGAAGGSLSAWRREEKT
jgi:xanthine dehydrogenase accessory factor